MTLVLMGFIKAVVQTFRSGSNCPIKFDVIIPASALPRDFILHKSPVFSRELERGVGYEAEGVLKTTIDLTLCCAGLLEV